MRTGQRTERQRERERGAEECVKAPLLTLDFSLDQPQLETFLLCKIPFALFSLLPPPSPPPFHMPRVLPWLLSTQQVKPKGSSQLNQGKASSNLIATSLIPLGFLVINFLMQCLCETAVFSAGEMLVT